MKREPFVARSLTLVPRSLLLNRTETLATQAIIFPSLRFSKGASDHKSPGGAGYSLIRPIRKCAAGQGTGMVFVLSHYRILPYPKTKENKI